MKDLLNNLLLKVNAANKKVADSINLVDDDTDLNESAIATIQTELQSISDALAGTSGNLLFESDVLQSLGTPEAPAAGSVVDASLLWQMKKDLDSLLTSFANFDADGNPNDYIDNLNTVLSWVDANSAFLDAMSPATTTQSGFMSSLQATKLEGIEEGANKTILNSDPSTNNANIAASTALTFALRELINNLELNKAAADHSHPVATDIADGLMSKEDKSYLDSLPAVISEQIANNSSSGNFEGLGIFRAGAITGGHQPIISETYYGKNFYIASRDGTRRIASTNTHSTMYYEIGDFKEGVVTERLNTYELFGDNVGTLDNHCVWANEDLTQLLIGSNYNYGFFLHLWRNATDDGWDFKRYDRPADLTSTEFSGFGYGMAATKDMSRIVVGTSASGNKIYSFSVWEWNGSEYIESYREPFTYNSSTRNHGLGTNFEMSDDGSILFAGNMYSTNSTGQTTGVIEVYKWNDDTSRYEHYDTIEGQSTNSGNNFGAQTNQDMFRITNDGTELFLGDRFQVVTGSYSRGCVTRFIDNGTSFEKVSDVITNRIPSVNSSGYFGQSFTVSEDKQYLFVIDPYRRLQIGSHYYNYISFSVHKRTTNSDYEELSMMFMSDFDFPSVITDWSMGQSLPFAQGAGFGMDFKDGKVFMSAYKNYGGYKGYTFQLETSTDWKESGPDKNFTTLVANTGYLDRGPGLWRARWIYEMILQYSSASSSERNDIATALQNSLFNSNGTTFSPMHAETIGYENLKTEKVLESSNTTPYGDMLIPEIIYKNGKLFACSFNGQNPSLTNKSDTINIFSVNGSEFTHQHSIGVRDEGLNDLDTLHFVSNDHRVICVRDNANFYFFIDDDAGGYVLAPTTLTLTSSSYSQFCEVNGKVVVFSSNEVVGNSSNHGKLLEVVVDYVGKDVSVADYFVPPEIASNSLWGRSGRISEDGSVIVVSIKNGRNDISGNLLIYRWNGSGYDQIHDYVYDDVVEGYNSNSSSYNGWPYNVDMTPDGKVIVAGTIQASREVGELVVFQDNGTTFDKVCSLPELKLYEYRNGEGLVRGFKISDDGLTIAQHTLAGTFVWARASLNDVFEATTWLVDANTRIGGQEFIGNDKFLYLRTPRYNRQDYALITAENGSFVPLKATGNKDILTAGEKDNNFIPSRRKLRDDIKAVVREEALAPTIITKNGVKDYSRSSSGKFAYSTKYDRDIYLAGSNTVVYRPSDLTTLRTVPRPTAKSVCSVNIIDQDRFVITDLSSTTNNVHVYSYVSDSFTTFTYPGNIIDSTVDTEQEILWIHDQDTNVISSLRLSDGGVPSDITFTVNTSTSKLLYVGGNTVLHIPNKSDAEDARLLDVSSGNVLVIDPSHKDAMNNNFSTLIYDEGYIVLISSEGTPEFKSYGMQVSRLLTHEELGGFDGRESAGNAIGSLRPGEVYRTSTQLSSYESNTSATRSSILSSFVSRTEAGHSTVMNSQYCTTQGSWGSILSSKATLSDDTYSTTWGYHAAETTPTTANATARIDSKTGIGHFSGGTSTTGADYAEYFENLNEEEVMVGTIVTLEAGKIRKATEGDDILGIISATAGVVGNDAPISWNSRYLRDEFGRIMTEKVTMVKFTIGTKEFEMPRAQTSVLPEVYEEYVVDVPLENPEFNPDLAGDYIPRSERKEKWSLVGLLGQLYVRVNEDITTRYIGATGYGSTKKTSLRLMEMTTPFDLTKGYGVAKCYFK